MIKNEYIIFLLFFFKDKQIEIIKNIHINVKKLGTNSSKAKKLIFLPKYLVDISKLEME